MKKRDGKREWWTLVKISEIPSGDGGKRTMEIFKQKSKKRFYDPL